MYSASVVDTATDFCFFEDQLTVASPSLVTYPEKDLRLSRLLAKEASL